MNKEYYATLTTPKGEVAELEVDDDGVLIHNYRYRYASGDLDTNAKIIFCQHNEIDRIKAPNAEFIWCERNLLKEIYAPEALFIECGENDILTKIYAPKTKVIIDLMHPEDDNNKHNISDTCLFI